MIASLKPAPRLDLFHPPNTQPPTKGVGWYKPLQLDSGAVPSNEKQNARAYACVIPGKEPNRTSALIDVSSVQ